MKLNKGGEKEIMIQKEFYPVGTIVSLFNTKERLMISGYYQKNNQSDKVWDYVGVLYPNGFLTPNRMVLFDHEQIESKYYLGCQNTEQMSFISSLNNKNSKEEDVL